MISFTKEAIEKLEFALEDNDIVRVGVNAGGCSGYSYSMAIEEGQRENDVTVEFGNVKVCLDPNSAEMLSHTVVHYEESIMMAGFKFDNQKATNTCGCGASFTQQRECPSNTNKE